MSYSRSPQGQHSDRSGASGESDGSSVPRTKPGLTDAEIARQKIIDLGENPPDPTGGQGPQTRRTPLPPTGPPRQDPPGTVTLSPSITSEQAQPDEQRRHQTGFVASVSEKVRQAIRFLKSGTRTNHNSASQSVRSTARAVPDSEDSFLHAISSAEKAITSEPSSLGKGVAISTETTYEKYEKLVELRQAHTRRLQQRQLQKALLGVSADPIIPIEIEDIKKELELLDKQIALLPNRTDILTFEQQKAVLEALARTGCEFIDRIRLIDIVIGSVIVMVEMSLAGAARLMALHRVKHPQLDREGITDVAVAQDIRPLEEIQYNQFRKAVRFEIQDLQSDTVSDTSPYASLLDTIPLRVTIDPVKLK
jgi:hypothetical protein